MKKSWRTALIPNYKLNENGVLEQINKQPFVYDSKYVSTYDTPEYAKKSLLLNHLRLGFLIASNEGRIPSSVIDFGCGNGDFLKVCLDSAIKPYGHDISGASLPEGVTYLKSLSDFPEVEAITFFDSLEHMEDISFLANLKCKTIVISCPYCHYNNFLYEDHADSWALNEYHHLKPNEHVKHFSANSLSLTLRELGYAPIIADSDIEDYVRTPKYPRQNILMASFKKIF